MTSRELVNNFSDIYFVPQWRGFSEALKASSLGCVNLVEIPEERLEPPQSTQPNSEYRDHSAGTSINTSTPSRYSKF
jgi:hypothetical protein